MALRVVGAGLGRTGTHSLKLALERLLGGPCYHMTEAFGRPDDTAVWHAAVRGDTVDWNDLLSGYVATVDWPAAAFWRELREANPEAVVLLSVHESPEAWHASMDRTILSTLSQPVREGEPEWAARRAMTLDMMRLTFDPRWRDREAAIAAYERHNAAVRRAVPAGQLIDWRVGDGWEPICAALGLPVPAEKFPHVNTTADFRVAQGLEAEA
jgi:Sulfotransferase domain